VETGGSNVQFAVCPKTGRVLVIEMNPRVSRSSALASKATGYPIAKIAAKLAVGLTLDELENDITGTSAAFEPTIDYVVVKWPRFAFEKFPGSDGRLGTQMKSVGEAMSIGRTFCEALQKAARSLETGKAGLTSLVGIVDYRALLEDPTAARDLVHGRAPHGPAPRQRAAARGRAFGLPRARGDPAHRRPPVPRCRRDSPGHLPRTPARADRHRPLVLGAARAHRGPRAGDPPSPRARRAALAREQASRVLGRADRAPPRAHRGRRSRGTQRSCVHAVYGRVDTCAAEFVAHTPYLYSTWETESEAEVSDRKKVVILGGGPNRIGQGIEFDYCCVHAVFALRELGLETVMVNCNPETVSTDYDTSDRLYFEPLTLEDVLGICRRRGPARRAAWA
jgi:carbamoyl-phosphate synthase large subunit